MLCCLVVYHDVLVMHDFQVQIFAEYMIYNRFYNGAMT